MLWFVFELSYSEKFVHKSLSTVSLSTIVLNSRDW